MVEIRSEKLKQTVYGSAFFSSPDGELVTNFHVMSVLEKDRLALVRFKTYRGKIYSKFEVGFCDSTSEVDLCILRIPGIGTPRLLSDRRRISRRGKQSMGHWKPKP